MHYFNKLIVYFSIFILLSSQAYGKEDHRTEHQPAAIEMAQSLSNQGTLKQEENGFVYLDVSNDLIKKIVPLLDMEGILRARPTAARSMGAHISVFHENENISPEEIGSSFSFDIKEVRSFTLHTRDGSKKLWVIAVHSPELEQLREKYGCESKLKGNEFHITLGKQMPSAPDNWEDIVTLSPFNFSEEPTQGLSAEGDFITVDHPDVIATAAKVNTVAQLKLKGNGFVYLDVDNQFVDKIWDQLPLQGQFEPISTKPKQMGAHISVIHEDEMISKEIWNLAQVGEWYSFEVKELRYVDRKTPKGMQRLWLLAADSPALERLRMHYGLKPKLQGHDFHITIGTEQLDPASQPTINADEYYDALELEYAAPAA